MFCVDIWESSYNEVHSTVCWWGAIEKFQVQQFQSGYVESDAKFENVQGKGLAKSFSVGYQDVSATLAISKPS